MGNPLFRIAIVVVLVFIVAVALYIRFVPNIKQQQQNTSTGNTIINSEVQNTTPRFTNEVVGSAGSTPVQETLASPIAEFQKRITKKFFGTYITPQNSPVQPEKFTGYHTGVDVEYTDTTSDVPVVAVASGKIVFSETASGYGGVFVLQFDFKEKTYTAIYGHIRLSTLPKVGSQVTKSQGIAVLGTGSTSETDGERHHLHFGIHSGTKVDIKGYVQNKSDLSDWVDPVTLY